MVDITILRNTNILTIFHRKNTCQTQMQDMFAANTIAGLFLSMKDDQRGLIDYITE